MRVFLDLSKAFDTIQDQTLFYKVEYYGIRGESNQWFRSYFANRLQSVKLNETLSDN